MSSSPIIFTPDIYRYYQSQTLKPHSVLEALRSATLALPSAALQICPEQGVFLQFLIRLLRPKKLLELGTFTGYSALAMALALEEGASLITCDIDVRATQMAMQYWQEAGVQAKIDLRIGKAIETLQQFIAEGHGETFDFIFIDADKQNYMAYYEQSLALIRPGGIMIIDNVLWYGRVADPGDQHPSTVAIRALNSHIYQDERIYFSMIPIGDGLTLITKK
jgi:predicted O-methyltransferase YrrM